MVYLVDYHIHLAGQPVEGVDLLCQRAIAKGLAEIALIDSVDFSTGQTHEAASPYQTAIEHARELYADRLFIRYGVEINYQNRFRAEIEAFLDKPCFDFTMASVQQIAGVNLGDEAALAFFADKSMHDAYLPYFEEVRHAVESKLFDLIGHFDYVKRNGVNAFGPFEMTPFEPLFREILRTLIRNKMGLEINTSGLRHPPREFYPAASIIKLYQEMGGEVLTIGSDAADPDTIGAGIPHALWMAHEAGFRFLTTFEQGEPAFVPIEFERDA